MLIDARCIYGTALSWYLNQTTHLVSDLIWSIITCLIVDPTRCTPLQQIVKCYCQLFADIHTPRANIPSFRHQCNQRSDDAIWCAIHHTDEANTCREPVGNDIWVALFCLFHKPTKFKSEQRRNIILLAIPCCCFSMKIIGLLVTKTRNPLCNSNRRDRACD